MGIEEDKLKAMLTGQPFGTCGGSGALERCKARARLIAETENGIAVLSDFREQASYIFSGSLGRLVGLESAAVKVPSAFEEQIFSCIPSEELLARHVLELRFLQLLKSMAAGELRFYNTVCLIHFATTAGGLVPVLHRTYYLETLPNGSIWLSLCLYTPFTGKCGHGMHDIVDSRTGGVLPAEECERLDRQLLSPREVSVLGLLARGLGSKQVADALGISVNTVSRHRQNILAALQVSNTAAAVEIGLRLRLIQ